MLADFEFQIGQRLANRLYQIVVDVSFIEADVVGPAERFVCKERPADRIDNVVHIDQIVEWTSEERTAGLAEDALLQLQGNAAIEAGAVDGGVSERDKTNAVFLLIEVAHPFRNGFRGTVEIGGIDRNRVFFLDQTMVRLLQLAVNRSRA